MEIKKHLSFVSKFATGQLLLQGINILNGFFLLRWLTIEQQAKFSVAFGIQSLILSLSDLGFTGSIVAMVGGRYNDKKVVGSYIQTAKRLRNYLFFLSCGITLVLLPFIIKEQSWSYIDLAIILAPVLLAVFWQADCSLYDSTLVMHKKMTELYRPQISVAGLKLVTNFILHITGFIGAFSTLIVNALALLFNGKSYKKKAAAYVEIVPGEKYEKEFKEMVNYLKPLFPSLVFNALYGQIQIFLISLFGKSSNIAEIAALGRLAQLFLFLNSLNSTIISPLMARTPANKLAGRYFLVGAGSLLLSGFIFLLSFWFPGLFLMLLGPKYAHLQHELMLMILNACLSYMGGVLWSMHSARKWLFWWGTWSYIICVVTCQVIGITVFNISTTHGVLCITTLTQSCMLLVHGFTGWLGFRKTKREMAAVSY